MRPFVKWAGGKERELKEFIKFIPSNINNYIEPFVGGGAVYFALENRKIHGKKYINDFSSELYKLYSYIKKQDCDFMLELDAINSNISLMKDYSSKTFKLFCVAYERVGKSQDYADVIEQIIQQLYYGNSHLIEHLNIYDDVFEKELRKCINIKIKKAIKLSKNNKIITSENLFDLYTTSLLMCLYNTIRYAYNDIKSNIPNKIAYFLYIREFCYSSMFRYNPQGDFNVPYGGMSYNTKDFQKTICYIRSNKLISYLKTTIIKNNDFEAFLNKLKICDNDFIFIDPPYDSDFSEYAKNEFDKNDHIRLANWLANTNARVMVVIKNTDFIYKIYNDRKFKIRKFNKKYSVNFQNRNKRDVEHLIITNYEMEEE